LTHKARFLSHALLVLAVASVILPPLAHSTPGPSEITLHSFTPQGLGASPRNGFIADAAGNLYGETSAGGAYGFGTVFAFVPNQQGGWTEQILHDFQGGNDGEYPTGGLIFDAAGNLYGTTLQGGSAGGCAFGGCGTVFELEPDGHGNWTKRILHNFDGAHDGENLEGGLVFDQAGNLYGNTSAGGVHQGGVVFRLSPSSTGEWKATLLYSFTFSGGYSPTPSIPVGRLVVDEAGNVFGATNFGGDGCSGGCGVIYELSPTSGGKWTQAILHNFAAGSDGAFPQDGLISDQAGNLYGTSSDGGTGTGLGCNYGCGTVYEVARGAGGQWTETVLYNFQGNTDGSAPESSLIFDGAGNLYGTTYAGGGVGTCTDGGCGTAFELSPASTGQWMETVLWRFTGATDGSNPSSGLLLDAAGQLIGETYFASSSAENGTAYALTSIGGQWSLSSLSNFPSTDGEYPTAGLVADRAGNLYGTTAFGGSLGLGAVFELSPTPSGGWGEKIIYSFVNGAQHSFRAQSPSGLVVDAKGNLYGENETGGQFGSGTVYELSPSSGGVWTEKTLYTFKGGTSGNGPLGGLVMDSSGNLYGTAEFGGLGSVQGQLLTGNGIVFELSPVTNGGWSQRVIYQFAGYPSDGSQPQAGLIFDKMGNLYGTTLQGGAGDCTKLDGADPKPVVGCGTAFELIEEAGVWRENLQYSFLGSRQDGEFPFAGLVFDKSGNLFGTTSAGGSGIGCTSCSKGSPAICSSCGTVFELSPAVSSGWTEQLLFSFPDTVGGFAPLGNLIVNDSGVLYGTTSQKLGACAEPCGTAFSLAPNSSGGWNFTVLHSFTDSGGDGGSPYAGLIFGPNGYLYGTTYDGGLVNTGSVFAIKP